ncbi:hypothetical protein [Jannaschia marina]|uniref:hypothetical protein n=1 Tax=Jannaschia marina TaxID=2741674 RepID=UPI0015CB0080|nr:hypothetical protein [Jannaschia marina]
MEHRASLPLFSLTYLPAAMLAGGTTLVASTIAALTLGDSATPCADGVTAAAGVSLALMVSGLPMVHLGRRALGDVVRGGAPVWALLALFWFGAALNGAGCIAGDGWRPAPVDHFALATLVFGGATLAVFVMGTWRLTRPARRSGA